MSPLSFIQSNAALCADCDASCPIGGSGKAEHGNVHASMGPSRRKRIGAGLSVYEQGEVTEQFYVLSKGWVCLYVLLPDGRRQNVKFAMPGDLIGFGGEAPAEMDHGAMAVTEATLCPIDRRAFLREGEKDPKLLMRINDYLVREQALMRTLLTTVSRLSAVERVAYLLCELHFRLFGRLPENGDRMLLPFTQEQIGDALGLSAVHVCRMLSILRRDGILGGRNQLVTICDAARLMDMAGNLDALFVADRANSNGCATELAS